VSLLPQPDSHVEFLIISSFYFWIFIHSFFLFLFLLSLLLLLLCRIFENSFILPFFLFRIFADISRLVLMHIIRFSFWREWVVVLLRCVPLFLLLLLLLLLPVVLLKLESIAMVAITRSTNTCALPLSLVCCLDSFPLSLFVLSWYIYNNIHNNLYIVIILIL
jgi:hypothetical protein